MYKFRQKSKTLELPETAIALAHSPEFSGRTA